MSSPSDQQIIGRLAQVFLKIKTRVNIFHWQTTSYAHHKESDKFMEKLTANSDKFIEILQGSRGVRLSMPDVPIEYKNESLQSVIFILQEFKKWLSQTLLLVLSDKDTDLMSLRDEMLMDVNQFMYLLSLS
jgi:hypothetical protein